MMSSNRGAPSDSQVYTFTYDVNMSTHDSNKTFLFSNPTDVSDQAEPDPIQYSDVVSIAGLSFLFFIIVFFGIVGNLMVILVILMDTKMRRSVTNLLIVNLAIADLIIMVFGVPEIVMFMKEKGWLLGPEACRAHRFILVVALYCSVLSLVTLCIERFIAIVFPLRVNKWCTRKSTVGSIFVIWIISLLCGLPVVLFNRVGPPFEPIQHCHIILPGGDGKVNFLIYKYLESIFYYFIPMIIQVVLYSVIAKRLYTSNEQLRTRFQMRPYRSTLNSTTPPTTPLSCPQRSPGDGSDTIRARRGVVKMLVCSVLLYFISYSPVQAHLIYNTFSKSDVFSSRQFFTFVMVLTHINSAANPFLYGIFSQNFRRHFKRCLMLGPCRKRDDRSHDGRPRGNSITSSRFISTRSINSSRTLASRV